MAWKVSSMSLPFFAIGRPRVSPSVESEIRVLREQGMGVVKIAKAAGCGVSTVQRVLAGSGGHQGAITARLTHGRMGAACVTPHPTPRSRRRG